MANNESKGSANRARSRAIRARMAETGENWTVAARHLAESTGAARSPENAALTGERYVVARRKNAEPSAVVEDNETERPYPWAIRVLHDLTHRVPGVPKHADPAHVRAEHEARHGARAAEVKARHQAHAARARARYHAGA